MQYFTNRFEVCTIDLTLNLLLLCVVLNGVITRSSESVDSSTVKLLHTNSLICDFEISTQRFRSAIVVDWMQQLCFITRYVVCTRSLAVASKGYEKSLDLYT